MKSLQTASFDSSLNVTVYASPFTDSEFALCGKYDMGSVSVAVLRALVDRATKSALALSVSAPFTSLSAPMTSASPSSVSALSPSVLAASSPAADAALAFAFASRLASLSFHGAIPLPAAVMVSSLADVAVLPAYAAYALSAKSRRNGVAHTMGSALVDITGSGVPSADAGTGFDAGGSDGDSSACVDDLVDWIRVTTQQQHALEHQKQSVSQQQSLASELDQAPAISSLITISQCASLVAAAASSATSASSAAFLIRHLAMALDAQILPSVQSPSPSPTPPIAVPTAPTPNEMLNAFSDLSSSFDTFASESTTVTTSSSPPGQVFSSSMLSPASGSSLSSSFASDQQTPPLRYPAK